MGLKKKTLTITAIRERMRQDCLLPGFEASLGNTVQLPQKHFGGMFLNERISVPVTSKGFLYTSANAQCGETEVAYSSPSHKLQADPGSFYLYPISNLKHSEQRRIKKSQRQTAVPCSCQEEPEARRHLYLAPGYQTAGEATPSVRESDPCDPVSAAPAAPQTARRQDILTSTPMCLSPTL